MMNMMSVLCAESSKRLNCCKSGFSFTGYDSTIPGYVIIPVKFRLEKKPMQVQELRDLGYKKVGASTLDKYPDLRKKYEGKELYYIAEKQLERIHSTK